MINLTKEEILAMEPGRKMDELIDKLVFRHNNYRAKMLKWSRYVFRESWDDPNSYYDEWHRSQEIGPWEYDGPKYSTDIAVAWEVFTKWGWQGDVCFCGDEWHCEIMYGFDPAGYGVYEKAEAKTAPEAICKAALLAVLEGDG